MCGICGYIVKKEDLKGDEVSVLNKMISTIVHRGPDEKGIYYENKIYMGMRRLSIIDIEGGNQPLKNEDGSIIVFQNGEIYNYLELRNKLEKNHVFKTRSDTEIIVHLYEEYGEDFPSMLNGMFAIALYDKKKDALVLVRDRFGIKPLYYFNDNRRFIYASELKSILCTPYVSKEIDMKAFDNFLRFQYVPHPQTMFKHIKKVDPGTILVIKKEIAVKRYYNVPSETVYNTNIDGYAKRIRKEMERSVELRLRSDVPVGVFLSGGIDSSIITGLASNISSKRVKTFSVGYKNVGNMFNEIHQSRKTAEHFKTDHNEIIVTPDIEDILYKAVDHLEEPCGDSSTLLTYIISHETAKYVKVALSGTGADELFAGYPRYLGAKIADLYTKVPSFLRKKILSPIFERLPVNRTNYIKNLFRRIKKLHVSSDYPWLERYLNYMSLFKSNDKNKLYLSNTKELINKEIGIEESMYHHNPVFNSELDNLNKILFYDIKTYLVDDLLLLMDKMSMASSLEVRVPFLDHNVVAASNMPSNYKLHGFQKKYILQEAFKDIVPVEIFKRKKIGFMAPIDKWLKEDMKDLVGDILSPASVKKRGFFDANYISSMVKYHKDEKDDFSQQIFSLMMLELWFKRYMD